MGLMRLITIAAVIWLAWFFYTRFQQKRLEKIQATKKQTPVSSVKKCAVCGIYVPVHEALMHDGRYYCSEAHKNSNA